MVLLPHVCFGMMYNTHIAASYKGMTGPKQQERVTRLDPISPEVVGRLKTNDLYRFVKENGLDVLERNLANLQEIGDNGRDAPPWYQELIHKLPDVKKKGGPRVPDRYSDHIRDLLKAGLLAEEDDLGIKFLSSYFSVEKTEETSRSIFNGRRLSKECPVPEPVNLCDTQQLVDGIRQFLARQAKEGRAPQIHVYGADFRHWFHQIPAPRWLRRLFGLQRLSGGRLQWKSLPMGWSWSPVLAQSAAWATLLFRENNEAPLLDEDAFRSHHGGSSRLPTWVDVMYKGAVHGIATVYYDNFLFICDSDEACTHVKKRIERNCQLEMPTPDGGVGPGTSRTGALIKKGSMIQMSTRQFCHDSRRKAADQRFRVPRGQLPRRGGAPRASQEQERSEDLAMGPRQARLMVQKRAHRGQMQRSISSISPRDRGSLRPDGVRPHDGAPRNTQRHRTAEQRFRVTLAVERSTNRREGGGRPQENQRSWRLG
jgi:hypothetical protein